MHQHSFDSTIPLSHNTLELSAGMSARLRAFPNPRLVVLGRDSKEFKVILHFSFSFMLYEVRFGHSLLPRRHHLG